jgi:hypothetical protein
MKPSDETVRAVHPAMDGMRSEEPDDELCRLALLADTNDDLPDDAVPIDDVLHRPSESLLPGWYMASPAGGRLLDGWRRTVVWLIIAAFLTITAYGLCNTYGDLVLR